MADNQPTVTITMSLANAILTHLKNGGNRLEADMLAEHLVNQSNAPAVEAARQKEIRDAVAQSKMEAEAKARVDAELFARGSVVVSTEEGNNWDGVDRPGVYIPASTKRTRKLSGGQHVATGGDAVSEF